MSQNQQQSLDSLYCDFERLHEDFANYKSKFDSDLNQLLEECQTMVKKQEDGEGGPAASGESSAINPTARLRLLQLQQQLKKRLSDTSRSHRELHAPLSKVGKMIDRAFVTELPATLSSAQLESDSEKIRLLNTAICEHLIREGSMEVAQELIRESGLDYEASQMSAYAQLNLVVESLAKRQLEPALQWLEQNRAALTCQETRQYLEFLVRRLQLLQLVSEAEPDTQAILKQARLLAAHSPACDPEIRRLMGSLAFVRRNLHKSPYKDLFESRLYHELSQQLVSEANKMLGFSKDLPLSVAIGAGCVALPPLINIQTVMSQRKLGTGISGELPIDIDLGDQHRFHSVFACPILRTQTSDANPPVRLVCGHAISRDAVTKLANNSAKFKCPYCPMEMELAQVQDIYF